MRRTIYTILYFLIPFLAFLITLAFLGGGKVVFGEDKEIPQLSELDKYKLKSQILEAENLNYQVQELSKIRDDSVRKANEMIEGLFTIYKVDKKDFNLDIQNQVFTPVKK